MMALLLVVMVGKVSDWVPGLSSIPLAKIAFMIAAVSAYRGQALLTPIRVRSLRIMKPAIAFMVLAILSVTFSILKSSTVSLSLTILIILLSMTLLIKVAQTPADLRRLIMGFVAADASLTLGLILNFHGGRGDINGNFDPNDIAYALDTFLPLVIVSRVRPSRIGTLVVTALLGMTVLAILLTGSRGGVIGLGVVGLASIAFPLGPTKEGVLKGFSLGRTLGRVVLLLAAGALSWNYLPHETQERMQTLLDLGNDYNNDPTLKGSRTVIWKRDINAALERPIGFGLGSAELVDGMHGGQYRAAHNSLVEALVELGVLGLGLLVASYLIAWRTLSRLSLKGRDPLAPPLLKEHARVARALRVSLVANLAGGFFLSNAYSPVLWMTIALCAALMRVSEASSAPPTANV